MAIGVLVFCLAFTPAAQAFEPHPLKAWLMQHNAEHRSVDEKTAMSQARKKAVFGAFLGGFAGAANAAVHHTNIAEGAAGGAIIGAVAGYAIGKMQDRQLADRYVLAQRVGYDAAQGTRAEVTRMTCDPCRVKPGQKFNVTVTYWAMAPENAPLTVSRHLGLSVGGSYIKVFTFDPDPFKVAQSGGEFETTLEYTIPKEGTYTMDWLIESDASSIQQAGRTNVVVTNAA